MAGEKHSNEIKEMMVRLYNGGKGKKVKDLAIEYGIAESTVRYWVVDKPKKENKNKTKESSNPEIEEMKKEIAKLKEENDILKKAMTIFAKN
ncbi:transposase [uncultured Ilyobacter sp.]|jgi:transposase|uniref:transposase n=1 Tax=uncultured Ilyobacter sp. TaxID=544433 RepID=UPI0029C99A6E|nr:transposase [uncultured Ilyobacter sp.]